MAEAELERPLRESDRRWAARLVAEQFSSLRVVSRGVLHDTRTLPGIVALRGRRRVGLLQYRIDGDQCEVVVLIAIVKRRAVGTRLLTSARSVAEAAKCRRLWLVTTNNNRDALAFYRAMGWKQVAIHRGAAQRARRLKPELPKVDEHGSPIEDEMELELRL
jgi:hypothetical protein